LPFPIVLALTSRQMPKLVGKYGFKRFLIIGPLVIAVGFLWLTRLGIHSSYWLGVLPAAIIMPLGIGMTMMPTIAAATSGVASSEAGVASGLITTSQQMGGALGLSILSGLAASITSHTMYLGAEHAAVHGYHIAFLASAGFMLVATLVAITVIHVPKKPQSEEAETIDQPRRLETSSSLSH
jgi:MFS family permease